jgi:preprotein translocase SecE subunit
MSKMVGVFYVAATLCVGVFLQHVLGDVVFHVLHINDTVLLFDWSLSTIAATVLAVGIAIGTWMRAHIRELVYDCAHELRNTTWPSWPETRVKTIAVLVTSLIFAGILGVFDFAGARIMTVWLPHLIQSVVRWGR